MADRKIGKIFVELDLDADRYRKGQKQLYKDATQSARGIEENFKKMGIKSSAEMDLMRAKYINGFNAIKNHSKSTANDILRAEAQKNRKLKELNEQQFGAQISIIDKIKKHWIAAAAAVYLAWKAVKGIMKGVAEVTMAAARYETLAVVMRAVGNNAGYSGRQMEAYAKSLQTTGISMTESRNSLARMLQAQLDLNNATKLGRIAQDAAVIGNMNSSQAFQDLIYGIQSANVRVLRTIGINVSFEKSYQKLARSLDRTTDSLTEREKAGARVSAVMDAGALIAGTYEAAMETAGKQVLSLQRHWDNLKVLSGTFFTPALLEIVQGITGSIKGLNGDLEANQDVMHQYGVNFRQSIIGIKISLLELGIVWDTWEDKFSKSNVLPQWLIDLDASLAPLADKIRKVLKAPDDEKEEGKTKVTVLWSVLQKQQQIADLKEKQLKIARELTEEGKAERKAAEELAEQKRVAVGKERRSQEENEAAKAKSYEAEKERKKELLKLEKKLSAEGLKEYKKAEKKRVADILKAEKEVVDAKIKADQTVQDAYKQTVIARSEVGKTEHEIAVLRIKERLRKYQESGADKVLIEQWLNNEYKLLYEQDAQAWEEKQLEKKKKAEEASNKLIVLSERTASAMEQNFSDFYFDVITGKFKTMEDYILGILNSIARATADMLGQITTKALINAFTGAATGAGSTTNPTITPTSPGMTASVFTSAPTRTASMTGNAAPINNYNVTIQAVDSKSFNDMVAKNPAAIQMSVTKLLKNNSSLRQTIKRTA